jgi:hypothetical protein
VSFLISLFKKFYFFNSLCPTISLSCVFAPAELLTFEGAALSCRFIFPVFLHWIVHIWGQVIGWKFQSPAVFQLQCPRRSGSQCSSQVEVFFPHYQTVCGSGPASTHWLRHWAWPQLCSDEVKWQESLAGVLLVCFGAASTLELSVLCILGAAADFWKFHHSEQGRSPLAL